MAFRSFFNNCGFQCCGRSSCFSVPASFFDFSTQSIQVSDCDKLSNVLSASVAKDLGKLEDFSVRNCDEMEEIVAWEEGSETNNEPLVFPEVTSMEFYSLPNIMRFYMGRHIVECPKLKRLAVSECEKLETFTTEATNEERKPIFSAEKVISNLEYMEISLKEAKWLHSNIGKYQMNCLKELCFWSLPSIEILYWFLHRIPNLEKLDLSFPKSGIKELVPSGDIAPQERLGTVLQLKELILCCSFDIKDIGFERDPVLQTVERLVLIHCHKLINLAHFSVSFTQLTYLEVKSCGGLINLITPSTAKSLVQLATMKIINCEMIKEIVTNEGNEEDRVVDIVFSKLITMELMSLKNLTSFCGYNNCEFKFPSLEKLIVRDCPKMETFTESHTRAPKLQNILAVEGQEEEKWYWEGDLNATIKQVFTDKVSFEYTERLELSDYYPELEQVWNGKDLVQENSFRNLKTLVVKNCENLVHVIPYHLLPYFENLEELKVQSCNAVQVIFNINDLRVTKALGTFCFKKLSLIDLPKLEHVWDKDPKGIFGLKVLQDVHVDECNSLNNLFPASVAKDLARLEKLWVTNCKDLVQIFAKDEIAAEGATKVFVFRRLTSLKLRGLPGLKYFYPGLHTLEWPVLAELNVYHCDLAIHKCQEAHPEKQVPITIEKVIRIPSLENLSLNMGDATVTWVRESQKLGFEHLQHFQEKSDSVVSEILQMVPNIEKLEVKESSFKEMFSTERPNTDYTGVLLHLKELKLFFLDDLESIGLEHSWLHPIPENLQTLEVEWCGRLRNIVPCTVSFSNLTYLVVDRCESLPYLFTSSTAKSLGRLKRMKISLCQSMEKIVREEEDEKIIIFGQLQVLYIENLPLLQCFCPGNFTLCFPSLEQVYVMKCRSMKFFSPVSIINPTKLSSGVGFTKDEDATRWEGDLNTTIRKTFEETIAKFTLDLQDLSFEVNHPWLQEIWHGLVLLPDKCFSNLESLVADGINFLTDVLPSHLLPCFTKLQRLEVRNCRSVKTIFDVKYITRDRRMMDMGPAFLPLKELILDDLPNLENVWNEDPDGILKVQPLQQVYVDNCKSLPSLFPASVAKDLVKLGNLVVKDCEELMAIVAEDEAAPKGTHEDEIIFGQLQKLDLDDLPNLRSFYNGSCTLSFPSLEQLSLSYCAKMETFCPGTINANKLSAVKLNYDVIPLEVDLNSAIQKAFQSNGHSNELFESKVDSHEAEFDSNDAVRGHEEEIDGDDYWRYW